MTESITLTGISGVTATSTDEVRQQRDELLLASRYIGAVVTHDDAYQAATTMTDIKALTRMVEASRNEVKAPVLKLGKEIDALAAELTAELTAEALRLGRLIGTYQTEDRRKVEAAQRAAWQAEQDVLNAARAEHAAALKANAAPEVVEAVEAKAFEAVAVIRATAPVAPTVAGTATRKVQHFEVTDASAAYKAQPAMFTLTPNTAAIKAILKSQPSLVVPGLNHWTEAVANVSGR